MAAVAKIANALRLVSVDAQAEAAGLGPGLTLSDARARLPGLETVEADPTAEARRLETLAEACRRYTPAVALDAPDGLWLDISGSAHLFGGERELAADLRARVQRAGFTGRTGIGDTPTLAWALARHRPDSIAPEGAWVQALGPLPPSALRIGPEAAGVLELLGVRTVSQLLQLPRAALARRLGEESLRRLDEALGARPCPLLTRLEVPPHRAEQPLAEPVCHEAGVLHWAELMARRLAPRLEGERQGGRLFRLELFRVDGAVKRLAVEVSRPLRDPARIAALFAERLGALNEGLEVDCGFDLLRLTAERLDRLEPAALSLLQTGVREAEVAAFVDRMDARLGPGSVVRLAPDRRTRTPELAVRALPYTAGDKGAPWWSSGPDAEPDPEVEGAPLRPLRLFSPPEPIEVIAQAPEGAPIQFRWRRLLRRMVKGEGPERLAPEWWREGAGVLTRDYYRVEDREGRRYWLFRQGLYGEVEGRQPCWFVHGLFP